MTKENFTSINVIIDESGSMQGLAHDTIGSFNQFLAEQKEVPGEAAFTLCTFNVDYRLVHDFIKLGTVPVLDNTVYRPSGGTALLDAVGTTIDSVGAKLAAMPEDERPSKVIFLIITDGEENQSHTFTKEQIRAKVEHQREAYKWEFVFIGANVDAFHEGQALGVSAQNSVAYTASKGGTHQLYNAVSSNLRSYRLADANEIAEAAAANGGSIDFFGQTGVTPTTAPATPVTPPSTPTGTGNQGNP